MNQIIIDDEFKNLILPLSENELSGLKRNIAAYGIKHPLVVWAHNGADILIDGHHRYAIHQELELTTPPPIERMAFPDREAAIVWVIDNQLDRRNISDGYRIELELLKSDVLKAEGRGRQKESGDKYKDNLKHQNSDRLLSNIDKTRGNNPPTPPHNTQRIIAAKVGVSTGKVAMVQKVLKDGDDKTKDEMRRGEVSVGQAYTQVKRKEKQVEQERRREENAIIVGESEKNVLRLSDITERFHTIVLDPPWDWGDEGEGNGPGQFGRGRPEYATIPIEQLHELPIQRLAEDNAHIYLWITNRSLPKGFGLLETWGFRYITCITWCKPSIGMGNYFRGSTEHLLFGVKGSLPLDRKDIGTWFNAARGNKHSEKPKEAYDIIESCSPPKYIDLFARKERNNWVTWGGEV